MYDLLHFYPRDYLDFSSPTPIDGLEPDNTYCIKAVVHYNPTENRIRKGMTIYKTVVSDSTGKLTVNIFNSAYQAKKLAENEEYFFLGKVTGGYGGLEMSSPLIEKPNALEPFLPIYPQTAGLNSNVIRAAVKNAIRLFSDRS